MKEWWKCKKNIWGLKIVFLSGQEKMEKFKLGKDGAIRVFNYFRMLTKASKVVLIIDETPKIFS